MISKQDMAPTHSKPVCSHCGVIIRVNKSKGIRARRAGEPLLWNRLQHYLKGMHIQLNQYDPQDFLCPKFIAVVFNYCTKTGFAIPKSRPVYTAVTTSPVSLHTHNIGNRKVSATIENEIDQPNEPGASNSGQSSKRPAEISVPNQTPKVAKTDITEENNNAPDSFEQPAIDRETDSSTSETREDQETFTEVSNSIDSQVTPPQAETCYSQSTTDSQPRKVFQLVEKINLCNIKSLESHSQSYCLVCKAERKENRKAVPIEAILNLWIEHQIFLPKENSRCCPQHLEGKLFSNDAKEVIIAKAVKGCCATGKDLERLLLLVTKTLTEERNVLNFDSSTLEEAVYFEFVGLSKADFNTLFGYIHNHIHGSRHRSPRNALAIFLTKLRLGISQKVIARLFGTTQAIVSATINRVRKLLMDYFVPCYLGDTSVLRDEILEFHNPQYVKDLFGIDEDKLALLADGTYVFIQKPEDHKLQSETYSPHKHRNLVKFMMIVTPDGYILSCPGPYKADAKHGDANIFNQIVASEDGLEEFLGTGDHVSK